MNVQHRHAHRHSRHFAFDRSSRRACCIQQRHIGRCSTHVEAQHAVRSPPTALRSSAPITPPAGPERIVRTGSTRRIRAERIPPDDCMIFKPAPRAQQLPPSRQDSPASSAQDTHSASPWPPARIRETPAESGAKATTAIPSRRNASATHRSCAGCANENRSDTATDSVPDSATRSRNSAQMSPLRRAQHRAIRATRSATPKQDSASGAGRCTFQS